MIKEILEKHDAYSPGLELDLLRHIESPSRTQCDLLDVHGVAELLKLKVGTVYNRSAPGSANPFPFKPVTKDVVGRRVMFRKQDVLDHIGH